MTVDFSARGIILTGRLDVAPKVNSLHATGMPCQWNTLAKQVTLRSAACTCVL